MSDRPIIFSATMIRALLDGRKRQTRRILKPQPFASGYYEGEIDVTKVGQSHMGGPSWRFNAQAVGVGAILEEWAEPRFAVGDRLWVRETARAEELTDGTDGVRYAADEAFIKIENSAEAADRWGGLFAYRGKRGASVPSIHMPRWASRLTLIVDDVKLERLQDISEEDAVAEGAYVAKASRRVADDYATKAIAGHWFATARGWYRDLWSRIHGSEAWDRNPWVVAVTFRTVTANIAAPEARAA